jgi:hypothetical protein
MPFRKVNFLKSNRNSLVKPEKVITSAIVKCLNNTKSAALCASNSRKVAALVSIVNI